MGIWILILGLLVGSCYSQLVYEWTQVKQNGDIPPGRFDFAYDYNKVTERFYIFGGQTFNGSLGDFYTFIPLTSTWTKIDAVGPSVRGEAAGVVFDGKFYLIGGQNATDYIGEIWVFSDEEQKWELVSHIIPLARGSAVNMGNKYILYYGGQYANGTYSNEIYTFSPQFNTWALVELSEKDSPGGRCWFSLVRASEAVILYGGYSGLPHSDLWFYDEQPRSWSSIMTVGDAPPSLSGTNMVYNKYFNSIILFGGENSTFTGINELWTFSMVTFGWQNISTPSHPPGRLGGGAFLVPNGFFVFGGVSGWQPYDMSLLNDMWILTMV